MPPADRAHELIDQASAVLLDFDGPVCAVFASYLAPDVANAVSAVADHLGVHLRPDDPNDPISVFRATSGQPAHVIHAVEIALKEAEAIALSQTAPLADTAAVLRRLRANGAALAIVTNNAAEPVSAFLYRHGLYPYIDVVVGREPTRPDLLKPAPTLVNRALATLDISPATAVFVGDSISDIQAGLAARVPTIGFANKSGKSERLALAGATALVQTMKSLLKPTIEGSAHYRDRV